VELKSVVLNSERRSTANHLDRLREGGIDSLEANALHFDSLHDLREIKFPMVKVRYPLLDGDGQLHGNRLRSATTGVD
jgi:phosphate:Na+ symporter